jgi:NADH-quinone oxidoreductase subunit D
MEPLDLLQPPAPPSRRREAPAPQPVSDEPMVLNIGPHHPSTHGVLRVIVELDGETVISATPDIGFLHTGIEKTFEAKTYVKGTTLAPRMGYLSPINNNLVYVLAVEKLLEAEIPARAMVTRVLLAELDRIASHLVYIGIFALDLGASSLMMYTFREREQILDIMEMVGGARMFPSYIRPGGLAYDLPPGFEEAVDALLTKMPAALDQYERLLTDNPLWKQRTRGVAAINAEQALRLGVTGAALRATGIGYDLRRAAPYCGYEEYDFDVPMHTDGDAYARYQLRIAEMRQSVRIARQALDRLPDGPYATADRKIAPPPKHELATSMEAVIHHFKLWTEGLKPPPGEAYAAIEAPRGEMGFYVVSDGSGRPYRVHMRSPSFVNLQALEPMVKGRMVADLVTAVASLDPVLGEVDR